MKMFQNESLHYFILVILLLKIVTSLSLPKKYNDRAKHYKIHPLDWGGPGILYDEHSEFI